ncbi:MAG TPA: phosphosulfolactate synthase [Geminicoccaceae bacterium]|nr:phosphosulfolactate synthase [Geminicoccaceae bacterium]
MTAAFPFSFIELPPERSLTKPRRSGLTMFADFGIPLAYQRDVLALAGRYVDLAKVATGTARLHERAYLERKLAAYQEAGIRPFMGGQFQGYVFATRGRRARRSSRASRSRSSSASGPAA